MVSRCLDCGREIEGTLIETPEGDTYHYGCVRVEYPEPAMTDDALNALSPEGTGEETINLFEYFQQNPYNAIDEDDPIDAIPDVNVRVKSPITVEISLLGKDFGVDVYRRGDEFNISPWLAQAIYFGSALEREYPAFCDVDDLYPRGKPLLSPEEERYD